ncbi:MAG TPA: ECF-type sigma factor [Vicinamibacterales bacterium]|jgi:RNA polymerase sigma factor (TIGR02999 family)|nr:ECF-type sigma factor [Vicinamibacterales bacterium]
MDPTISSLFAAAGQGERAANASLFAALYAELHRLAKRELARPANRGVLGVTTLLHETYVEMAGRDAAAFPDRARFMGYAARVMRGLIIEHARSRRTSRRGGQFEITTLPTDIASPSVDARELTDIGDALDELAKSSPDLAELVDLKFFCGFTFAELASMRGVSERTVQRDWEKARAYLHQKLRSDSSL